MKRRTLYAPVTLFFMLSVLATFGKVHTIGAVAKTTNNKKVIFISANAISLKDIAEARTPIIDEILRTGAIGLMNSRAAEDRYPADFYLSIGAGARAQAGRFGGAGFNTFEKVPVELYKGLRTSEKTTLSNIDAGVSDTAVVNISATYASQMNSEYRNNIIPGLLGETLSRANKKTAVVGNADTLQEIHREITLVSMDAKGKTDFGDVTADLNLIDKTFPGGLRTNYKKQAKAVIDVLGKADFVAVELGDAARIDALKTFMKQSVYEKRKKEAVETVDWFISKLKSRIDKKNTMIVIAAPQPQKKALLEQDFLTPLIIDGIGSGILGSNTTRRSGLVANVDVAPAIINYLDIPIPVEMSGNVIKARPKQKPMEFLQWRHARIYVLHQIRKPFLIFYSILIAAALVATLALIRFSDRGGPLRERFKSLVMIALLSIIAVPPASLIYLPLDSGVSLISYASFLAIVIALTLFARYLAGFHRLSPVFFLAGLTAVLVIGDTMTGTYLSERSFFGSNLMMGGRFYGIGNPFMGMAIGSGILSLVCFFSLSKRFGAKKVILWVSTMTLLFMAVVIGHPDLGANVGGLISGVAAALILRHALSGRKLNFKSLALNLIVIVLVIAAVLLFDIFYGHESKSHAGKAVQIIETQGGPAVYDIIVRKLRMNLGGSLSYPGYFALIMLLIGFALGRAMMDEFAAFGWLWKEHELVARGLIAMVWSAFLVLVLNDTGAVAAASLLAYLIVPLFYLTLSGLNNRAKTGSSSYL